MYIATTKIFLQSLFVGIFAITKNLVQWLQSRLEIQQLQVTSLQKLKIKKKKKSRFPRAPKRPRYWVVFQYTNIYGKF